MKKHYFRVLFMLAGSLMTASASAQSSITLSDFSSLNPIVGNDNWASQVRSIPDGTQRGQEVVPLNGGNPTTAGDAFSLFFAPIDLSGTTGITLLARALPGNLASQIFVDLYSGGSTRPGGFRWKFDVTGLSESTFTTLIGTPQDPVNGPLDFAHVDDFSISAGGTGSIPVRLQFANLSVITSAPEPSISLLLGVGGSIIAFGLCRQRR